MSFTLRYKCLRLSVTCSACLLGGGWLRRGLLLRKGPPSFARCLPDGARQYILRVPEIASPAALQPSLLEVDLHLSLVSPSCCSFFAENSTSCSSTSKNCSFSPAHL